MLASFIVTRCGVLRAYIVMLRITIIGELLHNRNIRSLLGIQQSMLYVCNSQSVPGYSTVFVMT